MSDDDNVAIFVCVLLLLLILAVCVWRYYNAKPTTASDSPLCRTSFSYEDNPTLI